jgi:excisionase family DNA binding protein
LARHLRRITRRGNSDLSRPSPSFIPALLPAPAAAYYIGVSESKLLDLLNQRKLRRKKLDGKRLFDRRDLDAYVDELPYEDDEVDEARRSCDLAFG